MPQWLNACLACARGSHDMGSAGTVAHTDNPSYTGGRDQEDLDSRPAGA
jgi:hypothetical protein